MINNSLKENTKPEVGHSTIAGLGFLEYLGEGVIVLDNERKILMVNSALENLLGWKASELVGQPCLQYICCQHPATGTFLCHNLCPLLFLQASPKQGQSIYYQEVFIMTKSGQPLEVSVSFAPLALPWLTQQRDMGGSFFDAQSNPDWKNPDPAFPTFSILLLRDVTELKRQERIKVEFITAASHLLRTPLTSIKTATGLLQEHVGEEFSRPLRSLLNNIQSSSARLERLVNDLIELTNLQSGRVRMVYHIFEARELVSRAIESSRESLQARSQTIKWKFPDEPLLVRADFSRMGQVLNHLISNASKFSGRGMAIELEISRLKGEKDEREEVVFSIRDEGVGIAESEKSLIFEKFYQSQISENVAEQGAGLGLPLAKALVELNGGRLWFESDLGQGSIFYFSLPVAKPNRNERNIF
jgi:signal transduction histidine kinase